MIEQIHRWRGGLAGTLLLVTLGLLYAQPRLLVASVVPLTYVLVGAATTAPNTEPVEIERTLEPTDPAPGAAVLVHLDVRNTAESSLSDVRVIDGVPEELVVEEGSPRMGIPLQAGTTHRLSYSVTAKRGDYDFGDPLLKGRTLDGSFQRTTAISVSGDTTLSCSGGLSGPAIDHAAFYRVGTHPTDTGGSGIEFHSTREYRMGDPLNRLDWRRYAKTGEMTTVQFREERAVRTTIVVDVRPGTRVIPRPGYPNGAELSGYAAERLYEALIDTHVQTSLSAIGIDETSEQTHEILANEVAWVGPSTKSGGIASARALFGAIRAAGERDTGDVVRDRLSIPRSHTPHAEKDDWIETFLTRLQSGSQVVLVSPLLDEWPRSLAHSLTVRGHDVLVLTPHVTGGQTSGQILADAHRRCRVHDIERLGATVITWQLDHPLELALDRSLQTLLTDQ